MMRLPSFADIPSLCIPCVWVVQEDRRKEILAKLSAERQALLQSRTSGSPVSSDDAGVIGASLTQDRRSSGTSAVPGSSNEHSRLLQKLFQKQRSWVSGDGSARFSGAYPADRCLVHASSHSGHPDTAEADTLFPSGVNATNGAEAGADIDSSRQLIDGFSTPSRSAASVGDDDRTSRYLDVLSDDAGSDDADGDGQLFYASDIVGSGAMPDAQACSRMESLNENEGFAGEEFQNHIFARQNNTLERTISKRIELLAQPRTDKFTERERQRLALEVQNFRECTFRPDISKSQARSRTKEIVDHDGTNQVRAREGSNAFPWLNLSPRRQSAADRKRRVQWSDLEHRTTDVIQRLHLDGTAKYEQRERAKAELEARRLQECTFKPKINNSSRYMLDIGSYKPIHRRLFDIQRAKVRGVVLSLLTRLATRSLTDFVSW